MISGETRLVGLLGDPVSGSLSPPMQNAAFAARGLDWTYVPLAVPAERLEDALRGLFALGFAGANVTTPHKLAVATLLGAGTPSVNTLVVRDGRLHGSSTDSAILADLQFDRAAIIGDGGAAIAFAESLPQAARFSRRGNWPPDVRDADVVVNATSERDEILVELRAGQTLVDLPYPRTATARAAQAAGARVLDGFDVLVAQGAAAFRLWTGLPAPVDVMRAAIRCRTADYA
ncbi:MAG: shikimate dehydrogenase (NADP+) [Actinobacteria bacterium]|nr:MAG: shikimate dehydrogenase (NADP+) [Actinomycetota bacterium]